MKKYILVGILIVTFLSLIGFVVRERQEVSMLSGILCE